MPQRFTKRENDSTTELSLLRIRFAEKLECFPAMQDRSRKTVVLSLLPNLFRQASVDAVF
jgi:hypothetical protein